MREEEIRQDEEREFGEVLRHELNNPLTGILGDAELVPVELKRKGVELPPQTQARLETIATLAVRMRETVRQLSQAWEAQSEDSRTRCRLGQKHIPECFTDPRAGMDRRRTEEHGA
jgi:nitrogen-specific signal transduction histidine kinase